MKKVMIIALILVGVLFIPVVSAESAEIYNETYTDVAYGEYQRTFNVPGMEINQGPRALTLYPLEIFRGLDLTMVTAQVGDYTASSGSNSDICDIKYNGNVIGTGECGYFCYKVDTVNYIQYWVTFDEINLPSGNGKITIEIVPKTKSAASVLPSLKSQGSGQLPTSGAPYMMFTTALGGCMMQSDKGQISTASYKTEWSANLKLIKKTSSTDIVLNSSGPLSNIEVKRLSDDSLIYAKSAISSDNTGVYNNLFPIITDVYTPSLDRHHIATHYLDGGSTDPTQPPDEQMVLRTGTVTMADNNGTTIRGFEVTAVNAYTDESYTVSTETDVAVITLPMDRTIEIRDPWTGEYEESPVGYYRFFGQSPGYKMLHEDGIQVSVLPEKYGSYELCDIRVTSESGYLSGKHLFQIRSRSDNSILQSGTISAKSATTEEWYNTTVSAGIASLILPYDTSNSQSEYAGNYYVYATSPGYEDSDFGTQIVVMPHTVSEIKDIYLTPIGGIPTPGNVTIRIQVFSETGPGVVNAEIFISGVMGEGSDVWDTYTASSTGYLAVSVPGNSTYDIVASGVGYYDSARRVEVFTEDPGLIEIKLYLTGAPTVKPTTQPTGWVTAPPTQTAPPIEEDNLIGLSVKGLAKGFGIDYDTALLLFGLMIIFGAGGIVMSSAKGGAMEFIAGSIVGTFVAFALGLIPIWIFIIIAVVFGAYVLRVFIQGGQ